jgi:hypothetical protein
MKRSWLWAGGVVAVVVAVAVGWYLFSPRFITNQVDEALPFDLPAPAVVAAMSADESRAVQQEIEQALTDEAMLEELPEATRVALEQDVMETLAAMPTSEMRDPMPEDGPTVVRQGQFQDADSFHKGSGSATIYAGSDGTLVLRFEDFSVTNGPALRVYLAENPIPTDSASLGNFLDLGELKGNVGSQNYTLPAGTDLAQFQSVVIYCQPFHVVFAVAPLQ